jgi:L-ascorbate metabolism protein UlaG (beta-lactamase superfamily)
VRLTHYGHACVVIEDGAGATGRILIDPGSLADDLSDVGAVDAVLITHEHPDHLEAEKLAELRAANPDLALYGNPGVPDALTPEERERAVVLASGGDSQATIEGWDVVAHTTIHAAIYPALPDITNNAYLIGGRVWHPGDAFDVPESPVDVLLLPIGAPWMKLAEAVDYLRAVAPKVAIPIHQGGLQPAHRELHCGLLTKFAPAGTELVVPPVGTAVSL